ncbi:MULTISPECIES: hypothetical protein [Rhodanobacter]|uniref:Uncharacterized protein n=1 Tax=Rhodanobacter sp. IGA1.0 TaxID=3158582 RepID=A0AAU7QNB2_9GAMM|nr:hypothetical protein [Rhodanobacter spathiphylli]
MKRCTTRSDLNQVRFRFDYECIGFGLDEIKSIIRENEIVSYSIPIGQSLTTTWNFRLNFRNLVCIEFFSRANAVSGWDETGSIVLRLADVAADDARSGVFETRLISGFNVDSVSLLVYQEDQINSECGMIFREKYGREMIVAAGVSPGSVSICADFSGDIFAPEHSLSKYCESHLFN